MRQYTILFFCGFILMGCVKVEMSSTENINANLNKPVSVFPTIEPDKLLRPVIPKIKLNSKQNKYLNESLPPEVREILEKAEKFEILTEMRGQHNQYDGEGQTFEPTRIVKIIDENNKRETLEAFYKDASREDSPAICFEPHHGIHATYQGKTVEIEICFSCARFSVTSPSGEFQGTIVREDRKSEDLFNRIIQNQSVEIN